VNSSSDTHELLELLQRCERDDAPQADLAALEALLCEQESEGFWGSFRNGLQNGLQCEADLVDLAPDVLRQVALPQAVPASALAALRGGLRAEAQQADVSDAVMHFVAPQPDLQLERHLEALADGLRRDARQHLPADLAASVLDRVEPERDRELERALAAMAHGLSLAAADVSVAEPVMQAVTQAHAHQLELCAMADGQLEPTARRAVAARLADDTEGRQAITAMAELGRQLRRALAHETAGHDLSAVCPAVCEELGIGEQAEWASLAQGIQAEAGEIDIADMVMDSILPAAVQPAATEQDTFEEPAISVEQAPVTAPEPRPATPWFRRVPLLSFAVSAVALLFVLNTLGPDRGEPDVPSEPGPELAEFIFEIADVNTIEIQQLEVAQNAMVQVFQLEEGAPMVILIDEGLEPDSLEGVTL